MRRDTTEGLFHLQLSRVLDTKFFWCSRAGKDGRKLQPKKYERPKFAAASTRLP